MKNIRYIFFTILVFFICFNGINVISRTISTSGVAGNSCTGSEDYCVQESGGDYTSLSDAVDACSGGELIEIAGSWTGDDTSAITWDVAVTVKVIGDSQNNQGYPGRNNGSYRLVIASGHVFTVTAAVEIWDMDILSDSTGVSDEIFRISTASNVTLKRCYVGFSGNTSDQDVVYYSGSGSFNTSFEGCYFFDVGRSVVDLYAATGTYIVSFNSCTGYNVGANGARTDGCYLGTSGNGTFTFNAFNNLFEVQDTYVAKIDPGATGTANIDYSWTNALTITNQFDTVNETGVGTSFTFQEGSPGAGDIISFIDVDTTPYDLTLFDHVDNDAVNAHSIETGPNSSLVLPTIDITGSTIEGASSDHDAGCYDTDAT